MRSQSAYHRVPDPSKPGGKPYRIAVIVIISITCLAALAAVAVVSGTYDRMIDLLKKNADPRHTEASRARREAHDSLDAYRALWESFEAQAVKKMFDPDAVYCDTASGCSVGRGRIADRLQREIVFGNDTDVRLFFREVQFDEDNKMGACEAVRKSRRKSPGPGEEHDPVGRNQALVFRYSDEGKFRRFHVYDNPLQTRAFSEDAFEE